GARGVYDVASNAALVSEFGTYLNEVGLPGSSTCKSSTLTSCAQHMPPRQGTRNDTRGTMVAHQIVRKSRCQQLDS
ncbi:hypothetical protein B0J15DRAFT_401140, partial [Fusarium solani]